MILSGDPVAAEEALSLGILGEVADGELIDAACAFTEKLVAEGAAPRRLREIDDKLLQTDDMAALLERTRKSIERRSRGLLAPHLAIESIANAAKLPFDEALREDRALFVRCRGSEHSKAQRHVFFAEREAAQLCQRRDPGSRL